jgi:hypothetical protein
MMSNRNTPEQQRAYNAALRDRKAAAGLKRVELWLHPDDIREIREHARRALDARGIRVGLA